MCTSNIKSCFQQSILHVCLHYIFQLAKFQKKHFFKCTACTASNEKILDIDYKELLSTVFNSCQTPKMFINPLNI